MYIRVLENVIVLKEKKHHFVVKLKSVVQPKVHSGLSEVKKCVFYKPVCVSRCSQVLGSECELIA